MNNTKIFKTAFSAVYPLYIQKAERKGRTKAEVDSIICWLTGYDTESLQQQLEKAVDFETFFAEAPMLHPNVSSRALKSPFSYYIIVDLVKHSFYQVNNLYFKFEP
ncbi:MAG: DUF2200 family protein, partial [Bacteroidia bacterium]|nr:DUF2200 family protein [Bacteroidia bacterium]